MATQTSLSRRPTRRFWGWGLDGDTLAPHEQVMINAMLARLEVRFEDRPAPQPGEFALQAPRIVPPPALAAQFSAAPLDRLNHCAGKSYADCARMWLRTAPSPPDWVAFPADEQAIVDILDWAQAHDVAVIPYGGGSSVCGGVEAAVGPGYAAAVSLDLERLNRVLEVDSISRAARIQAGALGPELEAGLKPHGLTLRHFPQSFEFSTLGGWIVTRSGGHYATQHTHIDDFVEATRLVTPAGVMQTRRLPGSGAGPAPDRLVIGSEGTLGVLTEAWVRLQAVPRFRASASVHFDDYFRAVACVRSLAQSGLNPEQLPPARSARDRVLGRRRRALRDPGARVRIGRPSAAGLDGPGTRTRERPRGTLRRRGRRPLNVR
jgi:alkyldihydroxyacetonephosphate synthase